MPVEATHLLCLGLKNCWTAYLGVCTVGEMVVGMFLLWHPLKAAVLNRGLGPTKKDIDLQSNSHCFSI